MLPNTRARVGEGGTWGGRLSSEQGRNKSASVAQIHSPAPTVRGAGSEIFGAPAGAATGAATGAALACPTLLSRLVDLVDAQIGALSLWRLVPFLA